MRVDISGGGNNNNNNNNNNNGVRIVNFATQKNLDFTSSMFPHQNIHKYTWTSPDGKTHNTIDHIQMIDRRWHSSLHDLSRGADCDTDNCLVVAKVREILAVSKQRARTFDMERFNLRKLSELEFRRRYQIKISNRFTALEN